MKIYISGPITGDPHYRAKFAGAEVAVRQTGHEPLNPAKGDKGLSDTDAMRRAVRMLLRAEAILLLPGWEQSSGAFAELMLARRLGLTVFHPEDFELMKEVYPHGQNER